MWPMRPMRAEHVIILVVGAIAVVFFSSLYFFSSLHNPQTSAPPTTAKAVVPPLTPEQASQIKAAQAEQQRAQAIAQATAATAAQLTARQEYAETLEGHLLSKGIDAHVRTIGKQHDTLRISWAAMSRPVVYNMMISSGMRIEVPSLGFKKAIFTDDGSFSGLSTETWTYHWDGKSWRPGAPPEEVAARRAAEKKAEREAEVLEMAEAERVKAWKMELAEREKIREQRHREECKKYAGLPAYQIPAHSSCSGNVD